MRFLIPRNLSVSAYVFSSVSGGKSPWEGLGVDTIQKLGALAFASRLRRLSDRLYRDVAQVYDQLDVDVEPRWFPLLFLLSARPPMAVTEAASQLKLTHPAVHQIATAMGRRGLLLSRRDPKDERRRLLALSAKGRRTVSRLRPAWDAIRRQTEALIAESGSDLLTALDCLEIGLDRRSMFDRVAQRLSLGGRAAEVVGYTPALKPHFRLLNYEWLTERFEVEPSDESVLSDPDEQIIRKGGWILFARLNGEIVGTLAMMKRSPRTFELAKMAVTRSLQGQGIGRKMVIAAIVRARKKGARQVLLHTSPKLEAARALYRSLGFVDFKARAGEKRPYKRETVRMELDLTA